MGGWVHFGVKIMKEGRCKEGLRVWKAFHVDSQ